MDCNAEIIRPDVEPVSIVSHGLCVACFVLRFDDVERQSLSELASRELEQLPQGGILLDQALRVVGYNEAETRITGLSLDKVRGREFFVEIAPCMAAPAVGKWCQDHVNDQTIQRKEVDWALTLREGVRLASLSLLAGRGRVAITVTLTPLELEPVRPAR